MSTYSIPQSFINCIRFYINDNPNTNVLLGEEESSDLKIKLALYKAVDDFNQTSPLHNLTVENFPYFSLLIDGAILQLLTSAGLLHSRNNLSYNAGGMSVNIWNKAKDYMAWIGMLQNKYESDKISIIRRSNINGLLQQMPAGVHSDFMLENFEFQDWL